MMNRENGVVRAAGWLAAGVSVAALVGAIGLPGCARDHAGATASTLKAGDTADPRTGLAPRAATAPRAAGTTPEQEKFLEDWAATYRFTHGQPKAITLTPDGTAVLFLRSGARSFVQDLYEFDVKTKQERVLLTAEKVLSGGEEKLTAEELARRERMRMASRGIVAYELSDDGKSILVPLSGRLFVVERASGASRELKSGAGYPIDPHFSPDGKMVACARDGDLYVIDIASGSERRLTTKSGPTVTNGLAEFIAQEEMDRFRGYWFSPNAKFIAYEEADTAGMETFRIADPTDPSKEATEWPYPRPGKKNASVKLWVMNIADGTKQQAAYDTEKFPYLATVKWETGGPLTAVVLNREQTEEMVYTIEPTTGKIRGLFKERDDAWVNIVQSIPRWLDDGSGFLWMSEKSGEWQLQLRGPDGVLVRELTPKGFGLQGLLHVDQAMGVAYVSASVDPTQKQVWVVPISDKPRKGTEVVSNTPVRLTTETGHYGAVFAKKAEAWLRTANLASGAVSWTVFDNDGRAAGSLKSVAEEPAYLPEMELTRCGGPKDFAATVIRPRSFDPTRKYPVVVYVYAGPHSQVVNATRRGYVLQQWIAEHGFIVVCLDGRGTPGRGREWERVIKGDFMKVPLEDQVEGLKQLGSKYPEMDLSRVGVYGWSFGGYFTLHAMCRRPDVYAAGVAGAPVADFADYDTCYTERFVGTPQSNPEGYRSSSALTYAKDLNRPLLIVHGTADDNVYFMHSLKMTEALFRAGKEFEFLPLVGFTHMVPDPVVTKRLYSRITGFFERELRP